jgi:hypothetical protein
MSSNNKQVVTRRQNTSTLNQQLQFPAIHNAVSQLRRTSERGDVYGLIEVSRAIASNPESALSISSNMVLPVVTSILNEFPIVPPSELSGLFEMLFNRLGDLFLDITENDKRLIQHFGTSEIQPSKVEFFSDPIGYVRSLERKILAYGTKKEKRRIKKASLQEEMESLRKRLKKSVDQKEEIAAKIKKIQELQPGKSIDDIVAYVKKMVATMEKDYEIFKRGESELQEKLIRANNSAELYRDEATALKEKLGKVRDEMEKGLAEVERLSRHREEIEIEKAYKKGLDEGFYQGMMQFSEKGEAALGVERSTQTDPLRQDDLPDKEVKLPPQVGTTVLQLDLGVSQWLKNVVQEMITLHGSKKGVKKYVVDHFTQVLSLGYMRCMRLGYLELEHYSELRKQVQTAVYM